MSENNYLLKTLTQLSYGDSCLKSDCSTCGAGRARKLLIWNAIKDLEAKSELSKWRFHSHIEKIDPDWQKAVHIKSLDKVLQDLICENFLNQTINFIENKKSQELNSRDSRKMDSLLALIIEDIKNSDWFRKQELSDKENQKIYKLTYNYFHL